MNILIFGDIFASSGREMFKNNIEKLINEHSIDFVIVNGENTTHGKSIIKKHYDFYKKNHVDVITSGNHIFKQKEVLNYINETKDLLKPMNMSKHTPGNGYVIIQKNNKKICVVNLMGNSFMDHANNVYDTFDEFLKLKLEYDILIIDFHAESTAEKIAFAWNYDGIINAFAGTHTHVQTSDERILPKGTAFITDVGFTGVLNSIIGVNPKEVIEKEKTGIPVKFIPAIGNCILNAVVVNIDKKTNKTTKIKRISIKEERE